MDILVQEPCRRRRGIEGTQRIRERLSGLGARRKMNQELEEYETLVQTAFREMNEAKQVLKAFDRPRFKFPYGSEERAIAEAHYVEALSDYHAKADAFAAARKQFDDARMHLSTHKG
jgi:hypothetical protein